MIASVDEHLGIAVADSPLGPFIPQPNWLFERSIDGHWFVDPDGTVYLYYVSWREGRPYGIYGMRMQSDIVTPDYSTEKRLLYPTEDWESITAKSPKGHIWCTATAFTILHIRVPAIRHRNMPSAMPYPILRLASLKIPGQSDTKGRQRPLRHRTPLICSLTRRQRVVYYISRSPRRKACAAPPRVYRPRPFCTLRGLPRQSCRCSARHRRLSHIRRDAENAVSPPENDGGLFTALV